MNRISREEYYMNMAVQASLRSTCIRRKVGAVIVNEFEYYRGELVYGCI